MINKNDQIRVGGPEGLDPISGLPMFRKLKSFEANRELEFIQVWYEEYLQYPTGVNTTPVTKNYNVKNITDQSTGFDDWYNYTLTSQMTGMFMGRDIIAGSINATLSAIPFNAPSGYIHL